MIVLAPTQRRWLASYGLTLMVLTGLAVLSYLRLPNYRNPPFNFYNMKPGETFNVYAMTRRQEGSVKLGFAENYSPPEIGAYGNHIIRYFGADAFERPDDAFYFFNYWYANLSLPEIHSYLRLVEQAGHLPKKLLLVQITPPNADNGHFIVNWGNELPPDVVLGNLGREAFSGNIGQFALFASQVVSNFLHEIINYNTFILGIMQSKYNNRVISSSICQNEKTERLRRMSYAIQTLIGTAGGREFYCLERTQWGAVKRDGSVDPLFGNDTPPTLNADTLDIAERGLNAGDENDIAREMRSIDAIGRRNGTRVVFLVPPVYETDRHESVPNIIFNRALALVPDIAVIDNRDMYRDPSLFMNSLHPGLVYYRTLVRELRNRGLVD